MLFKCGECSLLESDFIEIDSLSVVPRVPQVVYQWYLKTTTYHSVQGPWFLTAKKKTQREWATGGVLHGKEN
jgi:hypothetical protein